MVALDGSFFLELKDRHAVDNDMGEEGEVNTLERLVYIARFAAAARGPAARGKRGVCSHLFTALKGRSSTVFPSFFT
jgi:hypothetical protein